MRPASKRGSLAFNVCPSIIYLCGCGDVRCIWPSHTAVLQELGQRLRQVSSDANAYSYLIATAPFGGSAAGKQGISAGEYLGPFP